MLPFDNAKNFRQVEFCYLTGSILRVWLCWSDFGWTPVFCLRSSQRQDCSGQLTLCRLIGFEIRQESLSGYRVIRYGRYQRFLNDSIIWSSITADKPNLYFTIRSFTSGLVYSPFSICCHSTKDRAKITSVLCGLLEYLPGLLSVIYFIFTGGVANTSHPPFG